MVFIAQEEERDVVVALRLKTFASSIHMEPMFERIRRYLEVKLGEEVALVGYVFTTGDGKSLESRNGTETLAQLVTRNA